MKPTTRENGLTLYNLKELEQHLERDAYWLLKACEEDTGKHLDFNNEYIDEDSYHRFVKWFNQNHTAALPAPKKINKRKYSTTHRIHVAHRTDYKCAICSVLMPPEFEVDHIKALHMGGKDEFANLAALCPNCHGKKTRCEVLQRDEAFKEEFGKRLKSMQENMFEQFRHQKKSKYF